MEEEEGNGFKFNFLIEANLVKYPVKNLMR